MSPATSALESSPIVPAAPSQAGLVRSVALVAAIVLVVALVVASTMAWLAGDAPDLYAAVSNTAVA